MWLKRGTVKLEVLDLFSCIGGHALGLHAAGCFTTTRFVERNPFRRTILARRFPGVPIEDDVNTCVVRQGEADVVVGGPPCQGTSVAAAIHGKRTGVSLWTAMGGIIGRVEPGWVIVEQPPGNAPWEAEVTGDLEELGYHVSRVVLSAASLGGPHLRRRVFFIANRDLSRLEIAGAAIPPTAERLAGRAATGNPWGAGVPGGLRVADGVPGGMDRRERIEAIGDSNPPIMMAVIGTAIRVAMEI
jgi:DNA (cytosine-5)-methyltransferase 1